MIYSINDYIGIPFKIGGRDFDSCDCYGLVRLFYKNEFNIELPLFDLYSEFNSDKISEIVTKNKVITNEVKDNPSYGDIGIFMFENRPTHLGIYLKNGKVLHIMKGIDSVIERINYSWRLKNRLKEWCRPNGQN